MLTKTYYKTKPYTKVKFTLAKEESDRWIAADLVGEFSNWEPIPMKRNRKTGEYTVATNVPNELGPKIRFRYRVKDFDGNYHFVNDWHSDEYIKSETNPDEDDCVLVL